MADVFQYEARTKTGKKVNGTLEAEDESVVARTLKKKGYYILDITEEKEKKNVGEYFSLTRRVKLKDLSVFSQQFAAMIDAGVSLIESLEIMINQTEHPKLKEVLTEVQEKVETGTSLSEAMAQHSSTFPGLYVHLIEAGEAGGSLDMVLNNLAEHYEKQDKLMNMVKSALYYPFTILLVAVLVVFFLLIMVVPTFVGMFSGLGTQLPLPTRVLLGTSNIFQAYWWVFLSGIILLALIMYQYKDHPKWVEFKDKLILKIPIVGDMMKKIYISRFTSTLSMLLESGVDILTSLSMVENVVDNKVFEDIIEEARMQIREGVNLSEPLADSGIFPPMVVQMINVGEETGAIDRMLNKITGIYDNEVENSVNGMVSLIEPVMIVFLGLVVGFIVISIALPMFEMYNHM
ncbi:MAG: type II secretion system F family protein [bacterium]